MGGRKSIRGPENKICNFRSVFNIHTYHNVVLEPSEPRTRTQSLRRPGSVAVAGLGNTLLG